MESLSPLNILFIINPSSGSKNNIDWEAEIRNYFKQDSYHIEFLILTGKDDAGLISSRIENLCPQKVVAVGGDGTVCLVAGKLLHKSVTLGILPGGSANGMAAELNIPKDINAALDLIVNGKEQKCDVLRINGSQICIHLSDLGLNARLVKYFDKSITMFDTVAPNTFLTPISFVRCVVANNDKPSNPRHAINMAKAEKMPNIFPNN